MGWTCDAVGNRASEVSWGTTKTFPTLAASKWPIRRHAGRDDAAELQLRRRRRDHGRREGGRHMDDACDAESKLAKRTASNVTPAGARALRLRSQLPRHRQDSLSRRDDA